MNLTFSTPHSKPIQIPKKPEARAAIGLSPVDEKAGTAARTILAPPLMPTPASTLNNFSPEELIFPMSLKENNEVPLSLYRIKPSRAYNHNSQAASQSETKDSCPEEIFEMD